MTTQIPPRDFISEADATSGYWHNSAVNTLPPPDMMGPYMRYRPLPTPGVDQRRAHIIGGGIAGMAAAFYLLRDGHMPGENITIYESHDRAGGSLDGSGNAEEGYLIRGGREMNWNYDNFWDMFQEVPALELPEGYSVLDEYRLLNDADSNYSRARLMHQCGQIRDFSDFGLSRGHQWALLKLLLKRKEDLNDVTIEEYFPADFLETNFWYLWRSMFAFQNWHSLLEMKLYMHRFLDAIDGLNDMSALVFPKYNQYESFVLPLTRMLQKKGVRFVTQERITDLDFSEEGSELTVTGLLSGDHGRIDVGANDLVFALTGSMTEGASYGSMDTVALPERGVNEPGPGSDWALWENLARRSSRFGQPQKFVGDTDRSAWISATLTCQPSPLTARIAELAVNNPYSGRTVTGGIITFTDSAWVLSFTLNRQPHFRDQPDDVLVAWVYALRIDVPGNYVKKPMRECTGREILQELCYHLGLSDGLSAVEAATKVRTAFMPYITAEFMPRAAGDRPHVVPQGCRNLALVGQFVETSNDVVFTMESSVRTARIGVYQLLGIQKQVADISPTQYDIRNLLRGARALNNGQPFPGERLLHRLLDNTYFAHILPSLPDSDNGHGWREELAGWRQSAGDWLAKLGEKLHTLR